MLNINIKRTIFWSSNVPLEYVVAMVDAHFSAYQGDSQCSDADDTETVYMLAVYPSQSQLSSWPPPLPDAHT